LEASALIYILNFEVVSPSLEKSSFRMAKGCMKKYLFLGFIQSHGLCGFCSRAPGFLQLCVRILGGMNLLKSRLLKTLHDSSQNYFFLILDTFSKFFFVSKCLIF
jgi:hypothetical protein